jgi:hypothetical protein
MGQNQQGPFNALARMDEGLSPHIQKARIHHRSMARAMVAGGLRPGQLAEAYGMTPAHVSRIIGSPAFQTELARVEEQAELVNLDARQEVKAMAMKGLQNIEDDLWMEVEDHRSREIRQKASLSILEMAGIKRAGGGINITLNQNQGSDKKVEDLTVGELRDEITDLCVGEDGTYE